MTEQLDPAQARHNMWKWKWRRRVAIAQGVYPALLVIRGGRVLNVFTEELIEADVAIDAGYIVGIGSYPEAREVIELNGEIIAPSLIDAHIHLESSLLWVPEFARAVVPHGTGAVVTDPHEMANVAGLDGIRAMRDAAADLPLHISFTAPSCVPASDYESSGYSLGSDEIAEMLAWPEVVGLGEMMNFPGVLSGDQRVADILATSEGYIRDGHSPMLTGAQLQAYAGSGIGSDHESTSLEEAREKLRAGMMVMIREGSSEKNLKDLLPLVTDATYPRICFASDDRDGHDLLENGHVDDILRIAIAEGLDPVRAIRMATWNAANYWRLPEIGAVAPGYLANLVILSDLEQVTVAKTLYRGRVVAENGELTIDLPESAAPEFLHHTVNVAPVFRSALEIDATAVTKAVDLVPGQIVTRVIAIDPSVRDGKAMSDTERDLLKTVCVERHHATNAIGVGFTRGFGLKRGALATTIAHDAHNILAIGVKEEDILAAIALVAESQGGLAVVADGEILGHLPLPIAGLMSDQPLPEVAASYDALRDAAKSLGCELDDPFGQLAFLALSVIPEARITHTGLLDLTETA
ncbi:MAG TPA: adenine deaminase [Thermomicrobiales bacterium]|nr:adenine deaminase [Thermomicrobiales bacterium]